MIELRDLSLLQSHIGSREVRAGVDHPLIEPEPIEVVAEVIVAVDVVAGATQRIARRQQAQPDGSPGWSRICAASCLHHCGKIALDLDTSRGVTVAERQARRGEEPEQRGTVLDDDSHVAW